ncbi:MAG: GtrA family protein [Bacteroidales bacterium]|nr:GtrA family protein [Bacteroidales bacterium]
MTLIKKQVNKARIIPVAKRFAGFSSIGLLMTLFSMLLIYLFNDILKIDVFISYVISYSASILASYYLNTRFVFKKKLHLKSLLLYYATYLISMVLGLIILRIFNYLLPTWSKTIITYMVIPFTLGFNFLVVSKIMKTSTPKVKPLNL